MSAPTIRVNVVGKVKPIDARLVRVATREDFVAQYGEAEITRRELEAIASGLYLVVREVVPYPGGESVGRERTVHRTAVIDPVICERCKATSETVQVRQPTDDAVCFEQDGERFTWLVQPAALCAACCVAPLGASPVGAS